MCVRSDDNGNGNDGKGDDDDVNNDEKENILCTLFAHIEA